MPTTTTTPVDASYAQALLDLAGNQAESVGDEIRDLRAVLESGDSVGPFIASPSISEAERAGVLQRTFKDKVSPLVWSFLGVLNNNGRLKRFSNIATAYQILLDHKLGKIDVDM